MGKSKPIRFNNLTNFLEKIYTLKSIPIHLYNPFYSKLSHDCNIKL
jgi:hypothetical protein